MERDEEEMSSRARKERTESEAPERREEAKRRDEEEGEGKVSKPRENRAEPQAKKSADRQDPDQPRGQDDEESSEDRRPREPEPSKLEKREKATESARDEEPRAAKKKRGAEDPDEDEPSATPTPIKPVETDDPREEKREETKARARIVQPTRRMPKAADEFREEEAAPETSEKPQAASVSVEPERALSGAEERQEIAADEDEADEMTGRERVVRNVFLALLLIVATAFAYQKAWTAGYIWDDDIYVTTNELLTAPDGLKRIWLSLDSPSQYFPLVYTSFRIEHALWGLNATGYHLVNIALHIANALLLWRLLQVLAIRGAWLGAALFALHPVHVESVAWISERKNVLMGLFFLLALLAWHKFVAGKRRGSIPFYLLALLCFALALTAKTTACMLPVALLLISWLKRGAISLARVIQVMPFVLLGLAMGLLTIWWERHHQGTQGELFAIGFVDRILIAARGFWFYLYKLVWPAELAFSYPRWNISAANPADYLWLGAFVVLIAAIWILRRWIGRGPETALAFFFAMLAPTLGFVMLYTFRYTFVADHYQYLASIGPLALAAAALTTALNPLGRLKAFLLPVIGAALLIPLGLRTWQQSGAYKNEETLWRATLDANPGSWMAHNNLAIQLLNTDRIGEAFPHFTEAIRLDPNYAEAEYNLANAYFRIGRTAEARSHYERALQINPRIAVAHTNLGILLLDRGSVDEAIKHFEEAVRIEPQAVVARQRLSEALVRQGRSAEAVPHFDAAAKIDPATTAAVDVDNQIAIALLRQGRVDEAREQGRRTVEANPNDTTAHTNYGVILAELRQVDEAISHFQKALQIDPSNPEAHYNLGNAFLMRRQVPEAMEQYRRAVEIRPDYAAARLNLGNTLAESGRSEEAIAEYRKALEIRPDYANAHTNLATALNRLGRFDEAMTHLQAAWKLEAQARSASPTPTP